jgi:hypothetical protein
MQRRLDAELQHGERVLYAGRPDWRADWGWMIGALLFGLFWSSISFTFFGMAVAGLFGFAKIKSGSGYASTGLLLFLVLFTMVFVAIGCAFLAAPFVEMRRSNRRVHAVTHRRVMTICLNPSSTESYPLAKINYLKRVDRADGSGSLHIGYGVERDSDGDPRPLVLNWTGIPDVKIAERAIRDNAPFSR